MKTYNLRKTPLLIAAAAFGIFASGSAFGAVVAGALHEFDASDGGGGNSNALWNDSGSGNIDVTLTNATLGAATTAKTNITNAYSLNGFAPGNGGSAGATNLAVNRSTGATIETWIKRDLSNIAASTGEILIEIGGNNGYGLLVTSNTFTVVSADGGAQMETILDISSLDDSDYIHLTAVWDDAPSPNDQLVLYAKDTVGVAVSTSEFRTGTFPSNTGAGSETGFFTLANNGGGLIDPAPAGNRGHLGGNPSLNAGTGLDYFRGDMAVLRIYDTALDSSGVQQNFDAVFIPEPSTFALFGLGGLALILRRRK